MERFRVLGLRDSGEVESLSLEAADVEAARINAARVGFAVLEIAPERRAWLTAVRAPAAAGRIDIGLFCQELLALIAAGITVGEALETLSRKDERSATALTATRLLASVRAGRPLSAAMAEHPSQFPRLLIESMRASERTSDYAPALTRFIRYQRLGAEMRSKAVSAALYPLILLAVSGAVLLFLLGYVVPRFAQVYAEMGDRLPWSSRVLLQLGELIGNHPVVLAWLLVGLLLAVVAIARSPHARHVTIDLLCRIPAARRFLTLAASARMYRTLALLVQGGIALVPALRVVRGLLAADAVQRLDAAIVSVSEGRAFSDAMQANGLSTVIADRFIRVGEKSGRLGDMLDRAADFHEEDLARTADRIGRVVGPLTMLFMGVVIGLVVVLMYLPIFQLADAIQ